MRWICASPRRRSRFATRCARSCAPSCPPQSATRSPPGAIPARTTWCAGRASSPPRAGRSPIGRSSGAARAGAPIKLLIFNDELQKANAPESLAFGTSMVGPVIYTFGSQAQKERFLPRIVDLRDWWCQGFSEPGAGSDLAGLRTTAKRDGGAMGDRGPEDLDDARSIRRLDLRARAHRREREEAGGHFLLPRRHEVAGGDGAPDPDDRRRPRGQRGVLRRRARSPRQSRRQGEQGLGLRQIPARQRAQRHRARRHIEGPARAHPPARLAADLRRPAEDGRSPLPHEARRRSRSS